MNIPRNDFVRSRGFISDDPDAAYDEMRERRDEEARFGEPVLTTEQQARLDAADRDEMALEQGLWDGTICRMTMKPKVAS